MLLISLKNRPFLLFFMLTCLAFLLRFLIAWQDISYLDRLFIPDDTYYILSISRSIAAGFGPTPDGIHLTSGFQPLFCLLEVPFFFFGFKGDNALILAIYLSAFWGGLSTFVLASLLNSLSGLRAAIIGSLLWIFCPIILANDLNGMETSLAGFLSLLAILLVVLIDKNYKFSQLICLGLVCGLAFIARVDSCFLLLTIGIFALIRWGFYRTSIFVSLAFIVVLPWWIYSFKTFGSIVPESGFALKEQINLLYKSAGYLSLASLLSLIEWFPLFKASALSTVLGVFLTFYLLARGAYRAGIYGYLLIIPLFLSLVFYTFYLPVFWFFTRYYYFNYALIIICISLLVSEEKNTQLKRVYFAALLIILVTNLSELRPLFAKPEITPDAKLDGVKGYRDIALELNKYLAPGDVVGAFQSGALAYYAKPFVRVINLDGVVNLKAAKAIKNRALKRYVDSEKMNHFADWEGNSYFFQSVYGGVFPAACFNTIHKTKNQSIHRFELHNYKPNCE